MPHLSARDHDLYTRSEQRRARRQEPGGPALRSPESPFRFAALLLPEISRDRLRHLADSPFPSRPISGHPFLLSTPETTCFYSVSNVPLPHAPSDQRCRIPQRCPGNDSAIEEEVRHTIMNFRYQRTGKKRAIETAVASVIVCVVLGVSSYSLMNNASSTAASLPGKAIGWLSVIAIIISLVWSLFLFARNGNWLIEVTDTSVSWQAPSGIGEESFQVSLRDIEKVVCISSSSVELEDTYYLLTKPNGRIQLKPTHSGVNIHRFIRSLVENGVEYEAIDRL